MTTSNDQTQLSDDDLLRRAVRLAIDNLAEGRAPFGALVVRDGQIVGTGVNTTARDDDPTAHAEVEAVRDACRNLKTTGLTGAMVVSSCEPCVMCHATCAVAGVSRIIYAAPKEFVPGFEYSPPLLTQMQDALQQLAGDSIQYVPTPGADEPFARFLEWMKGDTR
ncbi:MAG TPA: nucleoside deaminase [Actinopolymorphaceae bacterium]|jgi:tRNA(Arg) A34 adenosine deaminase TadA